MVYVKRHVTSVAFYIYLYFEFQIIKSRKAVGLDKIPPEVWKTR